MLYYFHFWALALQPYTSPWLVSGSYPCHHAWKINKSSKKKKKEKNFNSEITSVKLKFMSKYLQNNARVRWVYCKLILSKCLQQL